MYKFGVGMEIMKISDNEDIKRLMRYLGAYKVIEGDLGLFDKLSRVKNIDDFLTCIYVALRVKDRILTKLIEELKKGEESKYEVLALKDVKAGNIESSVRKLFEIGEETVRNVVKLSKENPSLVAILLASLALAYSGIRERG